LNTKILQLSDLHCNNSSKWKDSFKYVEELILKIKPNIIIITGDSVESPSTNNFEQVKISLFNLYNLFEKKNEVYIITIPGNHDYYPWGNKLTPDLSSWPSWISWLDRSGKLFKKYFKSLQYPNVDDYVYNCIEILNKFEIAIYPFDSNQLGFLGYTAQGKIKDPYLVFSKYKEEYEKVLVGSGNSIDKYLKIAILHHHPLPLPTTTKQENLEPFMLLRNAHQFLGAAESNDVDIILHGHKHVPGSSEFRSIETGKTHLIISSCGSSCNVNVFEKEIRVIEVGDDGEILCKSYCATKTNPCFSLSAKAPLEFRTYANNRKYLNKLKSYYIPPASDICGGEDYLLPIDEIKNKTKTVLIDCDGSAVVRIDLENICWNKNIPPNERCLTEYLRAGIGRIPGGSYGLSNSALIDPNMELTWNHGDLYKVYETSPSNPEACILTVPHKNIDPNEEIFTSIQYSLINGYALTYNDHEEAYNPWPRDQVREEVCVLQSNYPTEVLELVIKFPNDESFPQNRYDFSLDVCTQLSYNDEANFTIQKQNYKLDKQETSFLKNKIAIRYRKSLLEVGVVVRHSQPNRLYILRWKLPTGKNEYKCNFPRQQDISDKLRSIFSNPSNVKLIEFYRSINKIFDDTSEFSGIDTWLFGYKKDKGYLQLIKGPETKRIKNEDVFVGRGVVGKSFRGRKVFYWSNRPDKQDFLQIPEYLVENYNPLSALALPLMYPKINSTVWNNLSTQEKKSRCPIFGIISLASEEHPKIFDIFEKLDKSKLNEKEIKEELIKKQEEQNKFLSLIYEIIWTQLQEHFSEIFNEM